MKQNIPATAYSPSVSEEAKLALITPILWFIKTQPSRKFISVVKSAALFYLRAISNFLQLTNTGGCITFMSSPRAKPIVTISTKRLLLYVNFVQQICAKTTFQ